MRTAIVLLFSICAGLGTAQEPKTLKHSYNVSGVTGAVWIKMPQEYKQAYVAGFDDALETDRVMLRELEEKEHPEIHATLQQLETNDPVFGSSPVQQIVDGLNSFYSDYRNENIHIVGAMHIVALELSGRSQAEIEASVPKLRQMSTQ